MASHIWRAKTPCGLRCGQGGSSREVTKPPGRWRPMPGLAHLGLASLLDGMDAEHGPFLPLPCFACGFSTSVCTSLSAFAPPPKVVKCGGKAPFLETNP